MSPVELRLRLITTEPLVGQVVLADDSEVSFDGWAGLAGALQAALAPPDRSGAPASPDQPASAAARRARPGTSSLP